MYRRLRRRGNTLIELLVVVAIIVVLMALLFGGVQKVRNSMNRLYCVNNQRTLTLALNQYESITGTYPQGTASSTLPTDAPVPEPYPGLSWMGALMQQLDQDLLWDATTRAYDIDKYPYDVPPHTGCSTVLKLLTCPGDNRVLQVQYVGGFNVALTSYLGVSGTNVRARDGILFSRSQVMNNQLANATLIVGERPPSSDMYFGWWYSGAGQYDAQDDPRDFNTGSLDVVLGVQEINLHNPPGTDAAGCGDGPFSYGPGKISNPSDQFHFWSLHNGGGNFGFSDGSVRFIPYAAASSLPPLARRSGQ